MLPGQGYLQQVGIPYQKLSFSISALSCVLVFPVITLTSRLADSFAESSEDAETFVLQRQGRKLLVPGFDWLGALW